MDLSHAEDGSRCTLTRLEAFNYEPHVGQMVLTVDGKKDESSGQSSGGKPITGMQFQQTDSTDGETRSGLASKQIDTVCDF